MSEITRGNWSFRDPGDDVPDGSVITGGNFSQLQPNTAIMVGKTLTIRGGNFSNVKTDANWTIEGGNFSQISRCTNIASWLVAKGLTPCIENCPHVVDVDTVTIDGVVVDTTYHYEHTRVV